MPIQPTAFDRAFKAMGIDFSVRSRCNWQNYSAFNSLLDAMRSRLQLETSLKAVRLFDAHSYCWIFSSLLKEDAEGLTETKTGHVVSGRPRSIIEMRVNVDNTVKNSNGQLVTKIIKNKELKMELSELECYISILLDKQENCCNLTG